MRAFKICLSSSKSFLVSAFLLGSGMVEMLYFSLSLKFRSLSLDTIWSSLGMLWVLPLLLTLSFSVSGGYFLWAISLFLLSLNGMASLTCHEMQVSSLLYVSTKSRAHCILQKVGYQWVGSGLLWGLYLSLSFEFRCSSWDKICPSLRTLQDLHLLYTLFLSVFGWDFLWVNPTFFD